MKTLQRKSRKRRLVIDALKVETFAAEGPAVEAMIAAITDTMCHATGRDSTCPCCSDPFTCPCSFPCAV